MTKLRTILSENLKTFRNERGFSQAKLAELAETAPNYIAMIEAGKRFPTDTMLEKIAAALQCEPCDLLSTAPLQKQWQEALFAEFAEFINFKMRNSKKDGF